jgi:short-subunit dehydrogenase
VKTHVVALDLARPEAPEALHAATERAGLAVDLLVNNAGFGLFGRHVEIPWSREREMLALDVVALAHLTKLYVADMLKRDKGWVIQVASIGAYQSTPSYAATRGQPRALLRRGAELRAWTRV